MYNVAAQTAALDSWEDMMESQSGWYNRSSPTSSRTASPWTDDDESLRSIVASSPPSSCNDDLDDDQFAASFPKPAHSLRSSTNLSWYWTFGIGAPDTEVDRVDDDAEDMFSSESEPSAPDLVRKKHKDAVASLRAEAMPEISEDASRESLFARDSRLCLLSRSPALSDTSDPSQAPSTGNSSSSNGFTHRPHDKVPSAQQVGSPYTSDGMIQHPRYCDQEWIKARSEFGVNFQPRPARSSWSAYVPSLSVDPLRIQTKDLYKAASDYVSRTTARIVAKWQDVMGTTEKRWARGGAPEWRCSKIGMSVRSSRTPSKMRVGSPNEAASMSWQSPAGRPLDRQSVVTNDPTAPWSTPQQYPWWFRKVPERKPVPPRAAASDGLTVASVQPTDTTDRGRSRTGPTDLVNVQDASC